ncbi:hypothetical protein [endosymbiont of unidentified scaly snail isolate Monju]|uniref:hypothetical protein n=1 Tax=endosymbiont of unidentified scaly snail isolate Monju TaxID=1248727 RepID=UPI000389270F|nr:hypothetical protein [endosymbiont of unidentified scaly snail isolate Monju]BAN68745.1 conserved hypothetical protein [endosymbiont of unidentified scaly snail isolate Monju]
MDTSYEQSREFVFFVDALKYSFSAADRYYKSVQSSLTELEKSGISQIQENQIVPIISDAWSMIDSAHRIRELIQQAPKLKKNSSEIQVFIRTTKEVEDLRHYVQHLRKGIYSLPEQSTPIWGVLSWVSSTEEKTSFTIISGTPRKDVSVYSCAYDTLNNKFAQKLILSVNNQRVDMFSLNQRIQALLKFVKQWAEKKGYDFGNRKIPVFTFRVQTPSA